LTTIGGILFFTVSCNQGVRGSNNIGGSNKIAILTLTTSAVKAPQGTSVTLTAAISADHTISGTVDFLDNGVALATGVPVSSGRATFSPNSLSIGTHSLTAAYSGDSTTSPAVTASPLFQVVTGDFNVRISGTSGSLNHGFNVDLTLQ
jgi:hypothetical protein